MTGPPSDSQTDSIVASGGRESSRPSDRLGPTAIRQKVELRFEKGEAVRFISHHDLMRAFQRAVRRAQLPVRLTEGFNPRPRIVFPVALEVGIASLDEAAELELHQWIPIQDLKERLAAALPPGLALHTVREMDPVRRGQRPVRVVYRMELGEAELTVPPERLEWLARAATLPYLRVRLERGRRKGRPQPPKTVDLRTVIGAVAAAEGGAVDVEILPTPVLTARPLEVLSLLLERPKDQLAGIRITKLSMTLEPTGNPSPETETESETETETPTEPE